NVSIPVCCQFFHATQPNPPHRQAQHQKKKPPDHRRLIMAPRAGFEPATTRLTAERSTVELPRNTPFTLLHCRANSSSCQAGKSALRLQSSALRPIRRSLSLGQGLEDRHLSRRQGQCQLVINQRIDVPFEKLQYVGDSFPRGGGNFDPNRLERVVEDDDDRASPHAAAEGVDSGGIVGYDAVVFGRAQSRLAAPKAR